MTSRVIGKRVPKWIGELVVGEKSELVVNPYGNGEKVLLCPLAAAVYDYIMGCEAMGAFDLAGAAHTYFYEHWPKEYMKLLD